MSSIPPMLRDPNAHPDRTDCFWHPVIGSVIIARVTYGPTDKPFRCQTTGGTFHASEQEAWSYLCAQLSKPESPRDELTYAAGYAYACGYRD